MSKVLFFDTETTGTDPKRHDVIQVAGIVEIDGKVREEFCFNVQPFNYGNISQEALDINGKTIKELRTFPAPQDVYVKIMKIFSRHIDKYDPRDKFIPAGQNVAFDIEFMRQFFFKNLDKYFGFWMTNRTVDLRHIVAFLEYCGLIDLPNHKLKTIADYYRIEGKFHDALGDVAVTRKVILRIKDQLMGGQSENKKEQTIPSVNTGI
jgi:DNA polymerase-3 subunit epsilon